MGQLFLTILLKASGIFKSYNALQVLKGIDITVKAGEIVSIVGASGAGKSTLLHILGTLDAPDRGTVELHDQSLFQMTSRQLANFRNQQIGFVFQFHNLLPEFTAHENVCLPGFIGNKNESEVRDRAEELLTYLGIKDRMDHKPSELSGGEQQRTAVARALINSPSIVLADEPSGNLDSRNARELHQLFFDLRAKFNQTFVVVTHNEELAKMTDRMLEIKDGVIQ
ncbi:MAG: lipoprotein-releasing system ATP-binding protein LolD [Cyclobacteriaceae bacterium]|nr:MAG: lipoprotein-releasing system ATP-binding protein LolD [Cyclobacteriaceae bacterium]